MGDLNGDKINDLVMVTGDKDKPLSVRFGLKSGQLGPQQQREHPAEKERAQDGDHVHYANPLVIEGEDPRQQAAVGVQVVASLLSFNRLVTHQRRRRNGHLLLTAQSWTTLFSPKFARDIPSIAPLPVVNRFH